MTKKNNFDIVPYTEIDGISTYKDSDILGMYDLMIEDGYGHIFINGDFNSRDDFLYCMKYEGNILYISYFDKKIALICWLNHFYGRTAHFQWCSVRGFSTQEKIIIAKETVKAIMNMKDKYGSYLFDLLIGYTSPSNMIAVEFMRTCGGIVVGEIPNTMWNQEKEKSESGYMIYYCRGIEDEDI